jgi:serine/threonine protein kinase
MAPEILSGRARKLGPQIDIWALGIILYGLVK